MTLDAGHSGYSTKAALVEQHAADYLLESKRNCPQTHATLQGLDWQGARSCSHKWERARAPGVAPAGDDKRWSWGRCRCGTRGRRCG